MEITHGRRGYVTKTYCYSLGARRAGSDDSRSTTTTDQRTAATTREPVAAAAPGAAAAAAETVTAAAETAEIVVADWASAVDEASGNTYYYNTKTGATSWVWPPE